MFIKENEIAGKYIIELGKKKVLNLVKYSDASSSIKQAVEETANLAKKSIESAVEPLKAKIAQKDEFISSQKTLSSTLQNQNEDLKQINATLQSNLDIKNAEFSNLQTENKNLKEEFKTKTESLSVVNENLKNENNDLKQINTTLQSNLDIKGVEFSKLQTKNKKLQEKLKAKKETINKYKSIVKEAYKQGITTEIREQKSKIAEILTSLIQSKEEPKKLKKKLKNRRTRTKKSIKQPQNKTSNFFISQELMDKIKLERKNQVLDKTRMEIASNLIKNVFEIIQNNKDKFQRRTDNYRIVRQEYLKSVKECTLASTKDLKYGIQMRTYTDINGNAILTKIGRPENEGFHSYEDKIKIDDNLSVSFEDYLVSFADKNDKSILSIKFFNPENSYITMTISDKNGEHMITSDVNQNKVIENLYISFNDVKSIECSNDKEKSDCVQHTIDLFTKGSSNRKRKNDFMFFEKKSKGKEHRTFMMIKGHSNDFYDTLAPDGTRKLSYGPLFYPVTKAFYLNLSEFNVKPWDFSALKGYIK